MSPLDRTATVEPGLSLAIIALCLPQILSTGILAVFGTLPDSAYSLSVVSLLSWLAVPAFFVAAYAGPLLLVFAGPALLRALKARSPHTAVAAVFVLLGLVSCAVFYGVVVWWDLPLP